MDVEELASFTLQRVTAYEGLPIDAATWNEAHMYHQTAQRLHTRALHGWGIVEGLAVVPADPPSRTVILQPGVAIDRDGHVIRVAQPERLQLHSSQNGSVTLAVRFSETPGDAAANAPPSRMAESFQFVEYPSATPESSVEVARVEITDAGTPIRLPANPWAPRAGEIDARFRRELPGARSHTVTIGALATVDGGVTGTHRQGLINLVRELRASTPLLVHFLPEVRMEQAAGLCDLLYMSGGGELKLTPREGASLLGYLRSGGILYAEPCVEQETQQGETGRFVAAVQRLMSDLKYGLEEVRVGHPLLARRYVFGLAPDGVGGHAPVLCKGNVILNPNDYGCCWQGGMTTKPLPREPIRAAMEFATNVAWYAAERGRPAAPGKDGHGAQPVAAAQH